MKNNHRKLICIVGATASGKTGLGVELAKKFNGEIVSADSRQVYRGLDIGTGKDLHEYGEIPYHLIDICKPGEPFTLFDWLALARQVIEDIWGRGKVPIIVGGTGLYVQALVEGFEIQTTEQQKNRRTEEQYSREELEGMNKEELAKILIDLDEEAFLNIDINNPVRSIRAIEKAQSGEKVTKTKPDFEYLLIGKEMPREELYSRIDRRVDEWFNEGFYEEVEELLGGSVSLEWLNKIGLEYKILANHIQSESASVKPKDQIEDHQIDESNEKCEIEVENSSSFESMKQKMKYSIHQYARRQLIWWRRFNIEWIQDAAMADEIVSKFLE